MSAHAISHFTGILGPKPPPQMGMISSVGWFQSLTPFRCSEPVGQLMLSVPEADEITAVLHKLNPNKAPRPDGLTSGLYKSAWTILGSEFVCSIRHFFFSSFMPTAANSTILSLVPKHPEFITENLFLSCGVVLVSLANSGSIWRFCSQYPLEPLSYRGCEAVAPGFVRLSMWHVYNQHHLSPLLWSRSSARFVTHRTLGQHVSSCFG
ncbi:hypothetical protein F2Q70_00026717 [Brassica cretica]|uniref:Uncharacterized protein n=1 Tax=Brassica cretica TaxID=69181 RepID=A0A8S9LDB1_BRACR|nr:hypothetical protein F2Q70_00026717 [Brassica cretica]